jgi:hypothetical protein
MMRHDRTLEELWHTAPPSERVFEPTAVTDLPPVAQRYFSHAFVPGAKLSTCVRLTMSGTIKLDTRWCAFEAEQVVRWDRGFVWAARARVNGLPVSGFDRLVDGVGAMRWKLLGLFPVMKAGGAQIARAAAGRLHAEAIWIPAALLTTDVAWTDRGDRHTVATFDAHGEHSELELEVSAQGAVSSCRLLRWGDMNTGKFAYHPFGGTSDRERTFDGVTIPVRHRVGWSFGTSRFEAEGEFFRCALHTVEFRK